MFLPHKYQLHYTSFEQCQKTIYQDYEELESGKISKLRPFGETLHYGLKNSRFDSVTGYVMWVEEDYCSPPLAMERESVLDRYFDDIIVERVSSEEDGWKSLDDKPLLWSFMH